MCLPVHDRPGRGRRCQTARVRWDALFADLEAQLDAADADELAAEIADRGRGELARLRVVDRLRGAVGSVVTAGLGHGERGDHVEGTVAAVGSDWVLLAPAGQPHALIPLRTVAWWRDLPVTAADPGSVGPVEAKLDLRFVLRRLARDRASLLLVLRDGSRLTGTIDRVGADFVDVAEHPVDTARRAGALSGSRTVPVSAVTLVRPA